MLSSIADIEGMTCRVVAICWRISPFSRSDGAGFCAPKDTCATPFSIVTTFESLSFAPSGTEVITAPER